MCWVLKRLKILDFCYCCCCSREEERKWGKGVADFSLSFGCMSLYWLRENELGVVEKRWGRERGEKWVEGLF
jgi:hypothetical protein